MKFRCTKMWADRRMKAIFEQGCVEVFFSKKLWGQARDVGNRFGDGVVYSWDEELDGLDG